MAPVRCLSGLSAVHPAYSQPHSLELVSGYKGSEPTDTEREIFCRLTLKFIQRTDQTDPLM